MSKLAAAVDRFPGRELEIHRLSARNPNFLAACEDFADALAALGHWRSMGDGAGERAEEYRQLVDELAAEVLAALDAHRCRRQPPDAGFE